MTTCLAKLDQAVSICGSPLNFDKHLKIDFEITNVHGNIFHLFYFTSSNIYSGVPSSARLV